MWVLAEALLRRGDANLAQHLDRAPARLRRRHVLVQAAWSYQRRPALSAALKRWQQGQSPQVIAHAWKAQHRVSKLFARIAARKNRPIAATAAARELVGFLWAVLQDHEVETVTQARAA